MSRLYEIELNNVLRQSNNIVLNTNGINSKKISQEHLGKLEKCLLKIINFRGETFESVKSYIKETLELEEFHFVKFEGYFELACSNSCRECELCFACKSFSKYAGEKPYRVFLRINIDSLTSSEMKKTKKNKVVHINVVDDHNYVDKSIVFENRFIKELMQYIMYYVKYKI